MFSCHRWRRVRPARGIRAAYRSSRTVDPAAAGKAIFNRELWQNPDGVYDNDQREWVLNRLWPSELALECGGFRMPVQPTPFGHIGLFPEQSENWAWLRSEARRLSEAGKQSPLRSNARDPDGEESPTAGPDLSRADGIASSEGALQHGSEQSIGFWIGPDLAFLERMAPYRQRDILLCLGFVSPQERRGCCG